MKSVRLIIISIAFTALFAGAAIAQAPQAVKIGVINTKAFDNDKTGIGKYVAGMDSVEKEFTPVTTEIQAMATKYENLRKEIQALQEQAQKSPTVPIKPETVNAKVDEFDRLGREIKFKQEEAKANFEKRQQIVMQPILIDIGKAMDEYAAQKGYALILDSSKLDQAGVILALNKAADVTDDFIKFYNAKPSGTATTKP